MSSVSARPRCGGPTANTVTASEQVRVTWRYLLVSESDIDDAKGSWPALKKLGS